MPLARDKKEESAIMHSDARKVACESPNPGLERSLSVRQEAINAETSLLAGFIHSPTVSKDEDPAFFNKDQIPW